MRAVHYLGSERSCRDASALFLRARSAEALAAIGNDSSPTSALLRARCQLRLGDPGSAISSLQRIDTADLTAHVAGEYHVLFGAALAQSGKRREAHEHFASAQVIASTTGGALQVELALHGALDAWNSRDLHRAQDIVYRALDLVRVDGDPYPRSFTVLQAGLVELLSLVAGAGEDYIRQAELLVEAWRLANDASRHEADIFVQASILQELAPLVWDLHLVEESEMLWHASTTIPWTAELATARWVVHRSLAWHAALKGHHIDALARFRECADLAPSAICSLRSTLDRAFLARAIREKTVLREEMLRAGMLAGSIYWDGVAGDEAEVLLDLAEASARNGHHGRKGLAQRLRPSRAPPKLHATGTRTMAECAAPGGARICLRRRGFYEPRRRVAARSHRNLGRAKCQLARNPVCPRTSDGFEDSLRRCSSKTAQPFLPALMACTRRARDRSRARSIGGRPRSES